MGDPPVADRAGFRGKHAGLAQHLDEFRVLGLGVASQCVGEDLTGVPIAAVRVEGPGPNPALKMIERSSERGPVEGLCNLVPEQKISHSTDR